MPTDSQICAIMREGGNLTIDFLTDNQNDIPLSSLNKITYAYIAPIIIACGIVGDILTVVTLTHPLMRKGSIVYTYLTLLAMTDLLTQFSVVPMILWLLEIRACSSWAAYFYAHVGFPLSNALMGASVWIVVFLTLSQYIAVCRPFAYGLRSRKICFCLFALSYIFNFCIYAPWATKKTVQTLSIPPGVDVCPYVVCDTVREHWFVLYEGIRELITRIVPFFIMAFMNARILITYRNTKIERMARMADSQKRFVYEKSEKEEKRLFVLLFAIIIVFFLCTIPAAPLTILVADSKSHNLSFQIFRAIVNLLEFTKFALNFYFYCLINPDIRRICLSLIMCRKLKRPPRLKGQPTTPMSLYSRSTKSTIRDRDGGKRDSTHSRRSSRSDSTKKEGDRRDSGTGVKVGKEKLIKKDSRDSIRNAKKEDMIEKLTVIRESESNDCGESV